jgi:hypothetical protein
MKEQRKLRGGWPDLILRGFRYPTRFQTNPRLARHRQEPRSSCNIAASEPRRHFPWHGRAARLGGRRLMGCPENVNPICLLVPGFAAPTSAAPTAQHAARPEAAASPTAHRVISGPCTPSLSSDCSGQRRAVKDMEVSNATAYGEDLWPVETRAFLGPAPRQTPETREGASGL